VADIRNAAGKRKPRAGACGICGAPVVVPDEAVVVKAFSPATNSLYSSRVRQWVDGHLYEMDDATGKPRLRRVRCLRHADTHDFDPRTFREREWW
jgi:hypothetical protein